MRKKKGFELRDVCGEHVIMAYGMENIDFSKIISLNETAAFLWKAVSMHPLWPTCSAVSTRWSTTVRWPTRPRYWPSGLGKDCWSKRLLLVFQH